MGAEMFPVSTFVFNHLHRLQFLLGNVRSTTEETFQSPQASHAQAIVVAFPDIFHDLRGQAHPHTVAVVDTVGLTDELARAARADFRLVLLVVHAAS